MMPNVVRGDRMSGLMTYLVGPGRSNEHTEPHLVGGDPALLAWHDDAELDRDARSHIDRMARVSVVITATLRCAHARPRRWLVTTPEPRDRRSRDRGARARWHHREQDQVEQHALAEQQREPHEAEAEPHRIGTEALREAGADA